MQQVGELHEMVPDYAVVLDSLATMLQQVAVVQLVGTESLDDDSDAETLSAFAESLSPELVQLFYQIAVTGRRDLKLAPEPDIGFEMTLLRMLSFQPSSADSAHISSAGTTGTAKANKPAKQAHTKAKIGGAGQVQPAVQPENADWNTIVASMKLRGAARQLAENCAVLERSAKRLKLGLNEKC